jgi:F-type H+-transporting ATPase subunit b
MRTIFRTLAASLVALFVTCGSAFAEEEHASGGEVIKSLLSPHTGEIVVAIVVFLVLLVVLGKTAWKPILKGLEEREARIKQAVDDAQRASEEARRIMAEYQAKLDQATEEARAIAEESRKDAEDVRRRIEEEARQRAEETIARSTKEIERAKDKAYDELISQVTAIAAEAASRIVQKNLTVEDNAGLVDEVIRNFAARRSGAAS